MEGQGLKSKAKMKGKAELAAVAMMSAAPAPNPNPPSTAYLGDLSCTVLDVPSVEEFSALLAAGGNSTNCLDSGDELRSLYAQANKKQTM